MKVNLNLSLSATVAAVLLPGKAFGQPPINDPVCNAANIPVGGTARYVMDDATTEPGEVFDPPQGGTPSWLNPIGCFSQDGLCDFPPTLDNTVWYSFTAPANGCVNINTLPEDGFGFIFFLISSFVQLALWQGDQCLANVPLFGTFDFIAANNFQGGILNPFFFAPRIENACVEPGEQYLVSLDGFAGNQLAVGDLEVEACDLVPLEVDLGGCQTYNGQDPNYLYPQIVGGQGPYTCVWDNAQVNPNCANSCAPVAVAPQETTTYCVTVTDSACQEVQACVTVYVPGGSCGKNNNKVEVCQLFNGGEKEKDVCVSNTAARFMMNHRGAVLGPCAARGCTATNPAPVALVVDLTTDNFPEETFWQVENINFGNDNFAGTAPFPLDPETSYTETFCVHPLDCYEVTILDSAFDGLNPPGAFSVNYDGVQFDYDPTLPIIGFIESMQFGPCAPRTENNVHGFLEKHPACPMTVSVDIGSNSTTVTCEVMPGHSVDMDIQVMDISTETGPALHEVYSGTLSGSYTWTLDSTMMGHFLVLRGSGASCSMGKVVKLDSSSYEE